jgi:signal transduction histidine kinase
VEVNVQEVEGEVLLEVTDDGVGGAGTAGGSGLRGLADRADALGGILTVDSVPGGGTRLTAVLPHAPLSADLAPA